MSMTKPDLPENLVDLLNASNRGLDEAFGLTFTKASYDEIEAELEVKPILLQPYGLVHGGVHCAVIETLASTGAVVNVMPLGQHAVGLENTTSFLRAVRSGRLRGRAVPVVRGRRTHVWEVTMRDDDDRLVAKGRVRMLILEKGSAVAGEVVTAPTDGAAGE
jgi:1,4-dihydroxy-2-naphthoyl-CoA hydrolase